MDRGAHRLSNLIGEDHDLAILDDYAATHGNGRDEDPGREAIRALISRRRRALQRQALALAKKLYRRPPRRAARLKATRG